jgi:hypothetical protein
MDSCAFCGRNESAVRMLFRGGGARAARPGMPPVHICDQCALQCADLVDEPPQDEAGGPDRPPDPDARILVEWTPFVVDDRRLEWAAAQVDIEGSAAVLISVRRAGRTDTGVGVVYQDGTEPTVERARETARSFWHQLDG